MTSNRQRRARKNARKNGQSDTPADRLPTQYEATDRKNPDFDPTRVIEAVRELLTTFPMPSEDPDPAQDSASGDERMMYTMAWDMTLNRNPLSQYQSLALLAGTIRWFSAESGRSETEILEVLAANFRHSEDHWQQELNDVLARMRHGRVDGEPPEADHHG